jgi:hypothetical protein
VSKFLGSGGSRANMEKSFRNYAKLSSEDRDAYTAGIGIFWLGSKPSESIPTDRLSDDQNVSVVILSTVVEI